MREGFYQAPVMATINEIENPYKEFTGTVANGDSVTISYEYSHCQILALSASTGVTLRFGASGTPSTIIGAGVAYKTPAGLKLRDLKILNNNGAAITYTIGLCVGEITDNRFATSSAVTITELVPTLVTAANATLSTTAGIIMAANSARKEAIITNNSLSITAYVGDSNINNTTRFGIPLKPEQSVVLQTSAVIYGVSASGAPTLSLAYTSY